MSVTLTGLGACREVGRSSFLLDFGEKIVLDRGLKVHDGNQIGYPLDINTNFNAVVLSHAHLDHSGDVPNLYIKSRVPCYLTPPTLSISEILWKDTLKIAEFEGNEPSFSKEDIERVKQYSFGINYNKKLGITKKCSLEFFDAGHILGSALSKLSFGKTNFLYTGDYNPDPMSMHKGTDLNVGNVDFVLTEATYGDRNHPPRKETEKKFIEKVQEGLDNNGTVLIPAFAVGRTQEIITILEQNKIKAPVFIDGMGQKVSQVYLNNPDYFANFKSFKKYLDKTTWVKSNRDRKKALDEPSVIVSTAGMLNGGPAFYYLEHILSDPNSKVILTGFQVEGTQGARLLEENKIFIKEKDFNAEAEVLRFEFSAHASQDAMLRAFKKWSPQKIFLAHGDPKIMDIFIQKIDQDLGIKAEALELNKKIKLD